MFVKEAMSTTVERVEPDTSVKESAVKMRDHNVGCLPVEEKGKLVGLITDRDITCRSVADGKDAAAIKVRDIMSKDIATCYDDAHINEATHLMVERGLERVPVLDHDEKLVGVLSLGDVSTHCTYKETGEVMAEVAKHHQHH